MEVILLERMRNLGTLGQQVKVKSGFARNYLVPYGKAVYATKDSIAKFELRRAELEAAAEVVLQAAVARQQAIHALKTITIVAKSGDEGRLFGSIGTRDIADAIAHAGVTVEKSEIDLPTGLIRQLGEYTITLELHSDVTATINVSIVPDA